MMFSNQLFDCTPSPEDYQLRIYDRFGEIVFESKKVNIGWNGKKNNMHLPVGVYVWTVRYKRPQIKTDILKNGIVTLLK